MRVGCEAADIHTESYNNIGTNVDTDMDTHKNEIDTDTETDMGWLQLVGSLKL